MRFKIEPDNNGYFLYAYIDDKWKLICFRFTLIGAKFSAWRYKKHNQQGGEFEL